MNTKGCLGAALHVISELVLCSVIKTDACEGHCALMSLFAITLGTLHFGNRLCYLPHPQEGVTLSVRVKPCCVPLEGFEIHNFQLTGKG